MSDFVTADTKVNLKAKPVDDDEHVGPTHLGMLTNRVLQAILEGHHLPWAEAKKNILYRLDALKCALGCSGFPMLKADVDESMSTVRFCQSIEDVEVARISDEVTILLRKAESPRYREVVR